MSEKLNMLKESIVNGDEEVAVEGVKGCIEAGIEPGKILTEGLLKAMEKVGALWEDNYFFLPDIIMAADAFKAAMSELEPLLGSEGCYNGKIVIGTVKGDLHDLGKNIVVAVLKGSGFEVFDLGIDVNVETFVEKTREIQPDFLAVGAYLSSTIGEIQKVIQALENVNLRDKVKVIIGGICTSQEYADQVGADLWGENALDAASKLRKALKIHA